MTFLLIAILLVSIGALRPSKSSSLFARSIMPTPTIASDLRGENAHPLSPERRRV